jgi:hypothetical protein
MALPHYQFGIRPNIPLSNSIADGPGSLVAKKRTRPVYRAYTWRVVAGLGSGVRVSGGFRMTELSTLLMPFVCGAESVVLHDGSLSGGVAAGRYDGYRDYDGSIGTSPDHDLDLSPRKFGIPVASFFWTLGAGCLGQGTLIRWARADLCHLHRIWKEKYNPK